MQKTENYSVPVIELKKLRLDCDAVAASNVFSFDDNLKIKKLGARAKRLYDESVGDAMDMIEDRVRLVQSQQATEMRNTPTIEEMRVIVENGEKDRELHKQKVEFEFDTIEIDKPKEEGWEKKFPAVKHIGYGETIMNVEPYLALMNLIEKGYLNIK